ncbi:hypothetical protein HK100_004570 [Physocladia obscura]|uniref:Ceramide glucosyltransferase n=1 Tax=Physocladia obscura TaxID=109957 RepID=A0AAD5XJ22_9FUNG|nr:hypothetical protein HK100_004570 [Physocladia obscura]
MLIGLFAGTSFFKYKFKPPLVAALQPKEKAPGVSILRPLKGVDANLYDNLASSFTLVYPNFEVLFSVEDESDPAVAIVNDLMQNFPEVDAKLVIGASSLGVNPKVNNLGTSYSLAKHEIVWILDSNIRTTPYTLARAVDCLTNDPNVGLVHHVPIGVSAETFGTRIEQLYLNTAHAKVYTMINVLRIGSCVIGKSMLFRKRELVQVGGLAYFGKYMSEDNMIGLTIWNSGFSHVIPADVVYQNLGSGGLKEYFMRRARWTRIRKFTVLAATLLEPFTECMFNGVIGAFGMSVLFGFPSLSFFAAHVICWFLIDLLFGLVVNTSMIVDNFPLFLSAWFLRELTSFPCYIYAFCGNHVEWRGRRYQLCPDGTVIPDSFENSKLSFVSSSSESVPLFNKS